MQNKIVITLDVRKDRMRPSHYLQRANRLWIIQSARQLFRLNLNLQQHLITRPKEAQKLVIDMAEFIGDRALMQHGIDAHAELIESLHDLFNETSYTIKKA